MHTRLHNARAALLSAHAQQHPNIHLHIHAPTHARTRESSQRQDEHASRYTTARTLRKFNKKNAVMYLQTLLSCIRIHERRGRSERRAKGVTEEAHHNIRTWTRGSTAAGMYSSQNKWLPVQHNTSKAARLTSRQRQQAPAPALHLASLCHLHLAADHTGLLPAA